MVERIVVGTDGSERAERAVRAAAALAAATDASLTVVCGFHEERLSTPQAQPVDVRSIAEQALARSVQTAEAEGVQAELHARPGDPAEVLLEVAEEVGAGLVVVGNRGMADAGRFRLGGVPDKVSHHARVSVLIVKTD